MITLNLVSEDIKKRAKIKEYFILMERISTSLVFFTLLIAVIMFSSSWFMHSHYNYQLERANAVTSTSVNYEKQVANINLLLSDVNIVQSSYYNYSNVLDELMKLKVPGISFNMVNISSKNNEINISGMAATRDDILAFQELVAANEYFENIDFPRNNILQRENISFNINASVSEFSDEQK